MELRLSCCEKGCRGGVKRLLVISNGAGEDAIASKILDWLPTDIKSVVACCPLVGAGAAYDGRYEICGPRVTPPSGGLFRESWLLALKDMAAGVLGGHLRQLRFLHDVRQDVGLTVAVGDLFPVLWSALAGCRPILFVGTAKSVYHHRYSFPERAVLRRLVALSLVRDEATADDLLRDGIKARCLGNAMMDEVQPQGLELPFAPDSKVVTVFPGSRAQAPEVLAYQLQVIEQVSATHPGVEFGVAMAPGTSLQDLCRVAEAAGWRVSPGRLDYHRGVLSKGECRVHFLIGVLGDLLHRSVLALGQAGTANEQAAGAGVPVVAYDPRGDKGLRWYRKRQKGLLGEAVSVVRQEIPLVASEMQMLLDNESERTRRALVGRERMGPAGGCERMAAAISDLWRQRVGPTGA